MDDLTNDPHVCTTHAMPASPQAAPAIPASVAARLLVKFRDVSHRPRAYTALAQANGQREQAWRLDKQAREATGAVSLIRPSLVR